MNKQDFPLLKKRKIHYLDNAATTQKTGRVIEKIKEYYENHNANAHRGLYSLSEETTNLVEESRKTFAKFLNAKPDEIIFSKNTTEGLNNLSRSLSGHVTKGDNIVVTEIEHHSNFVPWQQLSQINMAELRIAKYDKDKNRIQNISNLVDKNTKIVSFTMMSNVTGQILETEKIIKDIRKKNDDAIIILDAAQAASHMKINVRKLDCDFLCLSAHKIYGPTGVGIIYGKTSLLKQIEPFLYGGHMISNVNIQDSEWADPPAKFEAGTLNSADIIASAEAIRYIEKIGFRQIVSEEEQLRKKLISELKKIREVVIIGHSNENYGPVVSFNVKDIHPHDLAAICDKYNVCIRAGHHCAQPFMNALGVEATARASLAFYNDSQDITELAKALRHAIKVLKR